MPTTYAIPNGRTVMDSTLYTGNGYPTAGTQSIVNSDLGSSGFKPDFIWIKIRSTTGSNTLTDSVRGTNSQIFSNNSVAQETNSDAVVAFNTNGFNLGTNSTGVYSTVNVVNQSYVAWQWQAGQGTNTTNTNGTITSTVSVNNTAGFSIVTYTGNGVTSATAGHGLSAAPSMIIAKTRTGTNDWMVRHSSLASGYQLRLNSTAAVEQISSTTNAGGLGSGTSSVINFIAGTVNTDNVNASGGNYVAYCWTAIAGFSQFGSYVGNGSTDGPFVYLGFRPSFILVKRTDTTGNWCLFDNKRIGYNGASASKELYPNLSIAEGSSNGPDQLSNGFKFRDTYSDVNASGGTYIYMAFAENPFKYANAR